MYQAPQSAYDLFDKATVIYEGRQIYFGPVSRAKDYFVNLGFECPARQTTPDFLTSMAFPAERIPRPDCNPRERPTSSQPPGNGAKSIRLCSVRLKITSSSIRLTARTPRLIES